MAQKGENGPLSAVRGRWLGGQKGNKHDPMHGHAPPFVHYGDVPECVGDALGALKVVHREQRLFSLYSCITFERIFDSVLT
jgi:hypothetical protein